MARTSSGKALAALLVGLIGAACADRTPEPGVARGEALFDTCVPCHGVNGGGNRELGAPAIAGLPRWYVQNQLESFTNNWRGAHPFDTVGIRMKSMARALDLAGDLESVAEYVSTLPGVAPTDYFEEADLAAGRAAFASCAACHGQDGMGNEALNAPPIAAMSDWYLFGQLRKFKAGWRGSHPDDLWGTQMRTGSGVLTMDNAAMINVVSYIETLR